MNKLKKFALSQNEKSKVTGGDFEDCYVVRRVGNCDSGPLMYYFWDSCTGQCSTITGLDVNDCTPCNG